MEKQEQTDSGAFILIIIIIVSFLIFKHIRQWFTREAEPPEDINGKWLYGTVTSVVDGDGFKFYIEPGSSEYIAEDQMLTIRLAGIDAPECASPDMPAQPFSEEAKWHLNDLVFRKEVSLKLIKRDIYNRLLAVCFIKKFFIRSVNVNLKMVEDGFACVYKGPDAQYDGLLDDFNAAEENAKNKKLGMWNQYRYVSPMDHRRRWRRSE